MADDRVVFSHVLFFGRKFEEVLSLFCLEEEDLRGLRILDCNSGPDGFVGEANRRGFNVVGCDPLYEKSHAELREAGYADIAHSLERSRGHGEVTGDLDVEAFNRLKGESLEAFLRDYEEGKEKGWFVPGSLPRLPFGPGEFDLVLSAHFLFIASHPRFGGMIETEDFGMDFHRASVHELLRVSCGVVRLFPITKIGSRSEIHPWAAILAGELAAVGCRIEILENSYDQGQFTGHQVLVLENPPSSRPG